MRTLLGDIEPDAILTEGVLVGIKPPEVPGTTRRLRRVLIHGRILLMAEDDGLAGTTLSGALATLGTLGFLLVA